MTTDREVTLATHRILYIAKQIKNQNLIRHACMFVKIAKVLRRLATIQAREGHR